jgi:D-alanyl-D-alanine carboxypeptidase
VLTNAVDGGAHIWGDGIVHIIQAFARDGAPSRKVRDWSGRFWSLWGALDLLPVGNKVLALVPGFINPFPEASEIEVTGRTTGRITAASGFGSHGEPVRCTRAKSGKITEVWLAGGRYRPAARAAHELEALYGKKQARKRRQR